MENETTNTPTTEESSTVYIVGAIIVVAIIVAAVLMWPKAKPEQAVNTPTPEPTTNVVTKPALTKLTCESEWFNPVVGFPKYYLSASGGDISPGGTIECTFSVINNKETIVTKTMTVPVTQAPERGGTTFQCTTEALEKIPQNIPVTLLTVVKNEAGQTASCSGSVTFR